MSSSSNERPKQLVLSPSLEMDNRLTYLKNEMSFRSKQQVVEYAIAMYYQEYMAQISKTKKNVLNIGDEKQ